MSADSLAAVALDLHRKFSMTVTRDPVAAAVDCRRVHHADGATPAARRAGRVRVLGAGLARSWDDALSILATEEEVLEMDGERLITAREAWERMGVSERQFHRWVKQADVPRFRIGRAVRYKWSDIERALGVSVAQDTDGKGYCVPSARREPALNSSEKTANRRTT